MTIADLQSTEAAATLSRAAADDAAFARLPDEVRTDIRAWQAALAAIQPPQPLQPQLVSLARRFGVSLPTAKRKYYGWKQAGGHWSSLVNRAKVPDRETTLPEAFLDHAQATAERYQRKSRPAFRELVRQWRNREEVPGYEGHPGWPKLPRGWSESNLYRALRSRPAWRFHLLLARRGQVAARAERPLVLTTRRDLWVGSHLMFDDLWYNLFVAERQALGRPLELGVLDYYSACYPMRGGKIRQPEAKAILEADMRLLLVAFLTLHGYSPRGTTLVVENATAAIRPDVEAMLYDDTGGVIRVSRASLHDGKAKASHQWGSGTGGNPAHKAALESLHNLLQNETAALAAQSGHNRDALPEETAHLLKYTSDLLAAGALMPEERAAMLQLPVLTRPQWERAISEVVARVNGRTDHDLEGWEQHQIVDPTLLRARKLSPAEVYARGRGELQPIPTSLAAQILYKDLATPRTVRRRMIETVIGDVSSEPLHYDVHPLALVDGEKYDTVANPFDPSYLWVYNSKGGFIGAAPRLNRVSRGDAEALHREMGRVEKIHSELIAPFRQRHLKEARERKRLLEHNNAVLSGTTPQDKARAAELTTNFRADADTLLDAEKTNTEPTPPAGPVPFSAEELL